MVVVVVVLLLPHDTTDCINVEMVPPRETKAAEVHNERNVYAAVHMTKKAFGCSSLRMSTSAKIPPSYTGTIEHGTRYRCYLMPAYLVHPPSRQVPGSREWPMLYSFFFLLIL